VCTQARENGAKMTKFGSNWPFSRQKVQSRIWIPSVVKKREKIWTSCQRVPCTTKYTKRKKERKKRCIRKCLMFENKAGSLTLLCWCGGIISRGLNLLSNFGHNQSISQSNLIIKFNERKSSTWHGRRRSYLSIPLEEKQKIT